MPDYKPILFNTDMVKAILEGRKTQTRRIVKPKGRLAEEGYIVIDEGKSRPFMPGYLSFCVSDGISTRYLDIKKPANAGDILWVREAFDNVEVGHPWYYRADGDLRPKGWKGESWMPSIHMPKEAARIFLKVKDVRVELLQNIRLFDALNEGITHLYDNLSDEEYESWAAKTGYAGTKKADWPYTNYLWHGHFGAHGTGNKLSDAWPCQFSGYESPRDSFSSLWNSTVPLEDWSVYGWEANPWVWVIQFERCEKPKGWCS